MLDYPDDSLQNLVLDQRKTVSASSKRGDGGKPALAIDGLAGTAWISSKTDAEPSLTIDFKRAVRADRVVLSHVSSKELLRHHFDRATKVSVELGGKREPQIFELDRDEERKSILILSRSSKISQITIRVLERDKGQRHPGHVGFAEIELRKGE